MNECFGCNKKLLSVIAVVIDKEVTVEELIREGNLLGWFHLGESGRASVAASRAKTKALPPRKTKATHQMFIKVTNRRAITQDEYKIGKGICWPPKVFCVKEEE